MDYQDSEAKVKAVEFQRIYRSELEKQGEKKNPRRAIVKGMFWTYPKEYIICLFIALLAESCAIGYSFYIGQIIKTVEDKDASVQDGIITVAIWCCMVFGFVIFNNMFIFRMYLVSVRIRRVLILALYDKVANLSLKSLSETNSGKLITLISADIFAIEKGMAFLAFIIIGPLINVLFFLYLLTAEGWEDALVFAGITIVLFTI